MTEILTESFCERCGTRYTFESVAPRQKRLGGIKTLGKGLKNFVLSDDSSLDEAMAAARSDAERETTTQQLDAFHRTFNFCMSCRQYTCANCWNTVDARCLSCAPMAGLVDFQETVAEPDLERLLRLTTPQAQPAWVEHEHIHEPFAEPPFAAEEAVPAAEPLLVEPPFAVVEAVAAEPTWPGEPIVADPNAALPAWAVSAGVHPETPEATAEPAATAEPPAALDAAADAIEPPADAPVEDADAIEAMLSPEDLEARLGAALDAPEAAAETDEAGLTGLEPGASLDDAIAAYEASLDAGPAAAAPDDIAFAAETDEAPLDEAAPVAATRDAFVLDIAQAPRPRVDVVEQPTWPVAPAPAPEPEPEPVAAEPVAPETMAAEPVAAEAPDIAPAPVAEPEPVAAVDVHPDVAPAPPVAPQPAAPASAPQWPTGPRWPTSIPARQPLPPEAPAVDALTAIMARQATEAMWAASSRDVVQPPMAAAPTAAVQPCVSCGISLSATARFCRRCGTSQVA